jgi:hypothetical protein
VLNILGLPNAIHDLSLQQPDAVAAGGLADDLHQDVELVERPVIVPGAVGVKALCCCFHGK